ncbi:MAG: restriction endonuclease subunit S [Firmicutes bacterium]|nr:restriction endonuclease subunit S [Bacillota bacterium]
MIDPNEQAERKHDKDADLEPGFKMTELGPLPVDWDVVRLSEVADYINGYAFKSTEWGAKGLPIIRIQNLNDPSKPYNYFAGTINERYKVHPGDILISWSASLGAFKWQGQDAWLNQHIFKAIIDEKVIDRDYFYWMIKKEITRIAESARGSTMKHVTRKTFVNSLVPLPPRQDQYGIAHTLDAVQQGIEETGKVVDAARELKKSLMRHLFTYGPVPFNQADQVPLKETEIGLVPIHWPIVYVQEIAAKGKGTIRMGPFGSQLKKSELTTEGIKVYGQQNVIRNNFSLGDRFINFDKYKSLKGFEVKPEDILLTMMGTVGHSIVFPGDAAKGIIDSHLIRITADKTKVIPQFLAISFQSSKVKEQVESRGHGVVMKGLNSTIVKSLSVPLPPLPEQQEIARILQAVDKKIEAEENRKRALEVQFKTLLHYLMTGKIRVKDVVEVKHEAR